MSLTCHEEIGRVGCVGQRCYEDASDLSATSRACRARGIWRTTRPTDKRAALYTASNRRPTNQVSTRKSSDMPDILASQRGCRACRRRGCLTRMLYEETAAVEFQHRRPAGVSLNTSRLRIVIMSDNNRSCRARAPLLHH